MPVSMHGGKVTAASIVDDFEKAYAAETSRRATLASEGERICAQIAIAKNELERVQSRIDANNREMRSKQDILLQVAKEESALIKENADLRQYIVTVSKQTEQIKAKIKKMEADAQTQQKIAAETAQLLKHHEAIIQTAPSGSLNTDAVVAMQNEECDLATKINASRLRLAGIKSKPVPHVQTQAESTSHIFSSANNITDTSTVQEISTQKGIDSSDSVIHCTTTSNCSEAFMHEGPSINTVPAPHKPQVHTTSSLSGKKPAPMSSTAHELITSQCILPKARSVDLAVTSIPIRPGKMDHSLQADCSQTQIQPTAKAKSLEPQLHSPQDDAPQTTRKSASQGQNLEANSQIEGNQENSNSPVKTLESMTQLSSRTSQSHISAGLSSPVQMHVPYVQMKSLDKSSTVTPEFNVGDAVSVCMEDKVNYTGTVIELTKDNVTVEFDADGAVLMISKDQYAAISIIPKEHSYQLGVVQNKIAYPNSESRHNHLMTSSIPREQHSSESKSKVPSPLSQLQSNQLLDITSLNTSPTGCDMFGDSGSENDGWSDEAPSREAAFSTTEMKLF